MPHLQDNSNVKLLYGLLPALPVIFGILAVIWQEGITVYGLFAGFVLVCCGIGCGLFLWQRHVGELAHINDCWAQDEVSKIEAVKTYTAELERLLLTITPILSQHVMASREHTEQEIISLAARFAGMADELQQIVKRADDALSGEQHYHLDSVIGTSRDLLQPILESLRRIHQIEHQTTAELHQALEHITGLDSIATDVRCLTDQLHLLAFNSTYEATTQELNSADNLLQLANNSKQLDQRLRDQANDITVAVNAAIAAAESPILVDDSTLFRAEANVKKTLTHLGNALSHYRNDVEILRNNADQVRGEIANVLVALQFQDRVSQILTQVENNLLNLQTTIEKIQQQGVERDSKMLQVDEAVEHIEKSYKSVSPQPDQNHDDSDDLTFF